jgi:DNA segregation ATPase FtsK/SpoIIIE-like protein
MTWIISSGLKAGIHLFIVANRMSDKNLSPNIKANIPNRAVFTLTSAQDSRLSGVNGAETLKEGEMLYEKGNVDPKKLTTIFTPEANVKEVVEVLKKLLLTLSCIIQLPVEFYYCRLVYPCADSEDVCACRNN